MSRATIDDVLEVDNCLDKKQGAQKKQIMCNYFLVKI